MHRPMGSLNFICTYFKKHALHILNRTQAFRKLVNPDTKAFCVPTIFVTNAGNSLRQEKADKLSEWLNIPITEEQVCMGEQN